MGGMFSAPKPKIVARRSPRRRRKPPPPPPRRSNRPPPRQPATRRGPRTAPAPRAASRARSPPRRAACSSSCRACPASRCSGNEAMMDPAAIAARHAAALEKRRPLEPVWQSCYDHALPPPAGGPALFDATAADAAEQLAASLLAELTPPWSRWFGLAPRAPGGRHRSRPRRRRGAGGRGDGPARPFRPLQLRHRDAPGLSRPGGGRHRPPAGGGSAARRGVGLPLHRRAAPRRGAGGGAVGPPRHGVPQPRR